MGWVSYKGLQVPSSTTGDGGGYLTSDLETLADRTSGTAGSVIFVGASGYATQDNANFFFDDTNHRLGIGLSTPSYNLHIYAATPQAQFTDTSGRCLTITGPSGSDAKIELSGTGAGLDISTSPSGGGDIYFRISSTLLVQIGSGTETTLAVFGSLSTAYAAKTAAYTLTGVDSIVSADASGAAFTVTLPTAVGCAGREYRVKKIDASAHAVTIGTTSSQTIDGAATYSLGSQYAHVVLVSDGANWMVF